jgi:hypothetical protein
MSEKEGKLSLNSFMSNISKGGLSNASLFQILVTPPIKLNYNNRELKFRIEATEFPGRNIDVFQTDYNYMGGIRNVAYGWNIAEIPLTILLSEDMKEKDFFLKWQSLAIGDWSEGGDDYDIGFYEDYIGEILMLKLNNRGEIVRRVKLLEAYPVTVGANQVSWADDSFQRLDVTFVYKKYENIE